MNKFALVNLKGGLGNQIFQVSFANYLRSIGFYTFLDTSFYESNHTFPRKLEIDPELELEMELEMELEPEQELELETKDIIKEEIKKQLKIL